MTAVAERPEDLGPPPEMRRMAALLEYAGGAYAGWQSQQHAASLQQAVERAFGFIAAHPLTVVCAGRTDAGVHAAGQVIHFDTHALRAARSWVLGANTRLPPDIAVLWAAEMPRAFHARYSALRRTYRYLILNRSARSALSRGRAAWIHRPLDADTMQRAAQALIGEHDFSAFRGIECQSKSPRRRIERLSVERVGEIVSIEITANAFLHHMVRNIVGTLIEVQERSDPLAALASILESRDRRQAGATAPACGLYLWRVEYPATFCIPVPDRSRAAPGILLD
jgi:tRNA pseudouridine38-40 synthase